MNPLRHSIVAALMTLLPLAGCSVASGAGGPPTRSQAASDAHGCPDLAGEYANSGSYRSLPDGGSRFLSWHLRVPLPLNDPFADRIRVHPWKDGKLLVEAMSSGKVIAQRQLDRAEGHMFCEAGALVFPSESETRSDAHGVGRTTTVRLITRGTDGSILSEERQSTAALAMWVVPMGGSQSTWIRWPRV